MWSKHSAGCPSPGLYSLPQIIYFPHEIAVTLGLVAGYKLIGVTFCFHGGPKAMVVSQPLVLSLSCGLGTCGFCFFYVEIDVSVYGASWTSVVGSHSMHLVYSTIQFDTYLQSFQAGSWVVNAFIHYFCCGDLTCAEWFTWIIWYSYLLDKSGSGHFEAYSDSSFLGDCIKLMLDTSLLGSG